MNTDAFDVKGHVEGSAETLALKEAKGNFSIKGVEIDVDGSIGEILSLDDIDLQIKASGGNLAEVGPVIKQSLPETGPFTLSGRLTGSAEALALQDARGKASHRSLNLTLNGGVKDLLALSELNLNGELSGRNLAEVGPVIKQSLPETGPFTLSGRLTGSVKALALQDVRGKASQRSLNLTLNGAVKDLLALSGLNLNAELSGGNLAEVGPVIKQSLPETGPFTLSGRLTGSVKALALQDVRGKASQRSLNLTLNGAVKDLLALSGLNLNAELSGGNLAEVGPVIKQSLPETGPFTLSGRLTGSVKALALQDVRGKASQRSLNLTLNGAVKDLLALSGLNLNAELSGGNLAEVGPVIKQSLPETGPFTLSGRLTGSVKALALQDVRGKASQRSLNLTLNGAVKDLLALSGLNLNAELSGRNLAEVGPVIKQSLPETGPFTLSGRLTGSAKALALQDARGKASHRSLNLTLNGGVKDLLALSGLDLNVRCSGKELSDIGPWVGGKLPELGKFDIKGHLTGSAMLIELDGLSALVDQSDLNGSARVEFRKRSKITAILESGLPIYAADEGGEGGREKGRREPGV